MNATAIDPLEELVSQLDFPVIHHIDVCGDCKPRVALGVWVIARCGISKDIEGRLPSEDWVSCKDCQAARRAACTFCGKVRQLVGV